MREGGLVEPYTTHGRVARRLCVLLMLAAALLLPPRVSAFQEDVHYDATFAVALAVG